MGAEEVPPIEEIVEGDMKKVITYNRNAEGQLVKTTRTYKIEGKESYLTPMFAARRSYAKFGQEKGKPAGPDPMLVTLDAELYLELKSKKAIEDTADSNELKDKLTEGPAKVVNCRICKGDHWTSKCPYKDNIAVIGGEGEGEGGEGAPPPSDGLDREGAPGGVNKSGIYVPPRRTESSMDQRDDTATVRVTNLSENTREDDLKELFGPFGPIQRVYLATDNETGLARGFAFIKYYRVEDGQKAIDKLCGHGYDHLILHVEWSKPTPAK